LPLLPRGLWRACGAWAPRRAAPESRAPAPAVACPLRRAEDPRAPQQRKDSDRTAAATGGARRWPAGREGRKLATAAANSPPGSAARDVRYPLTGIRVGPPTARAGHRRAPTGARLRR